MHLLSPHEEASWSLKWGESRSRLVGLPAPLVVFCAGIMRSTLLLPLAGSHLKGGSWVLAFSYLIVYNLPQLLMHIFIFSPLEFLCILLFKKTFVQVQALQ